MNFYILALPRGADPKEATKKLYELELFAEQSNQAVPAPIKLPPPPPADAPKTAAKKPDAAKPEKVEKKLNPEAFIGSWFTSDKASPKASEETATHAFTIRKSSAGQLNATPPRRASGTLGSITKFDINGKNLKMQIKWTMSSIPTFWKTEDFDLNISDDETKLVGTYEQKSSGAKTREFSETDKVFTRQ